MRVLYHHRTQAGDAQGIHIYEMARAFRDLGHEVEMVSLVERDRAGGSRTRGAAWSLVARLAPAWLYEILALGYNLVGYRRLAAAIRGRRPDVIYERYSLNTFCGVWASRRFGIPLVLEVNAPLALEQARMGRLSFRRLARWSERWICSRATVTLAVSAVLKGILVEGGVPASRVTVMPNGIDPVEFHPGVDGAPVRRRLGVGDAVVVGFIGWLRPWHGLERLLDALHAHRRAWPDVRVLLVGDGPALPDLRAKADALGLGDRVVFAGPIDRREVPAYLAAMDVAVQPSAPEYACPMKVIEYMGLGRCIVAPDQANVRELLEEGTEALLFDPVDPGALARALDRVIGSPALREALGRAARSRLETRGLFWQDNARRSLDLASGAASCTSVDTVSAGRAHARPRPSGSRS